MPASGSQISYVKGKIIRKRMNELISVIIPVYKTEKYVQQCVDSVRNQTCRDVEIILVDDGSPDGSGALCDALAKEDERIRVIHKENGGLSSARNAGLDAAKGTYVAFLDSDDWIDSDMYEKLHRDMAEQDAQIACCNFVRFGGGYPDRYYDKRLDLKKTFSRDEAVFEFLRYAVVANSACPKLYRRSLFESVRFKEGIIYEDLEIMPKLLCQSERVTYTGEAMYHYRRTPGSITNSVFSVRQYDCIGIWKGHEAFFEEHFPSGLPLARAHVVRVELKCISAARADKSQDVRRRELRQEAMQMLARYPDLPLTRNLRVKILLCKMGLPIFDLAMSMLEVFRKA